MISDPSTPIGLYIHWPYCARICPYCDFNVYKAAPSQSSDLLSAMVSDLNKWREIIGPRQLSSIHFGGGTPSLMTVSAVEMVLNQAEIMFGFASNIEIGLEANPNDQGRFKDFKVAGIERLSVGAQAFNDTDLSRLGREHTANTGLKAIESAQNLFKRVSIDLIYARERQSLSQWQAELDQALSLGLDHLSLYQLTIEPGTAFAKQAERGTLTPADDDLAADMFTLTQDITEAFGIKAYEISNYARTQAHQSRHNRLYWEGADWIGIGPGAHSRLGAHTLNGRYAYVAEQHPITYIKATKTGSAQIKQVLSAEEETHERILMGLRLIDGGLNYQQLQQLTGLELDQIVVQKFIEQGFLNQNNTYLTLTKPGRIYGDKIAAELCM